MEITGLFKNFPGSADTIGQGMAPPKSGEAEEVRDTKLRKACGDFEAMLLNQLMQTMRKSVPEGGLFGDSFAGDLYQTMQDEAVARQLAEGQGAGLGEILYRQLSGDHRSSGVITSKGER
ncbi:MAG: rod-binding protein [Proteobacteria bacterium]|nr:rod-binding protein [Pseudomonadota bacterium]MBU1687472.1 rod-binding protein [Pseudomonadota bacterium]